MTASEPVYCVVPLYKTGAYYCKSTMPPLVWYRDTYIQNDKIAKTIERFLTNKSRKNANIQNIR